jgi:lipopolysaccharide biosynthesis glycosyltransferase
MTTQTTSSTPELEKIHVAFCINNNYAEYTGVAAYSLCKNMAPEDRVVLHIVMSEVLNLRHRKKFRQLEQRFDPRVEIKIYDSEEHIHFLNTRLQRVVGKTSWWPIDICTKLLLSEILPLDLDKIIGLDGDTLVYTSLRELWNKLPAEGYALAAPAQELHDIHNDYDHEDIGKSWGCTDIEERLQLWLRSKHLPIQTPFYVDAGMLVWDIRFLRQNQRLAQESIDWLVRYEPPTPELHAITVVFRNHILPCIKRWNVCNGYLPLEEQWRNIFSQPAKGISIIHYLGSFNKPWKLKPQKIIKQRWRKLISYLFLRPPTIWHKYRQGSPWRHSLRERFREFFATPEDRKLFKPIFTGIAATLALMASVSLYYLGRFFFS